MKSHSDEVFPSDRWRDPRGPVAAPKFPHVLYRPEFSRGRFPVETAGLEVRQGRKVHFCVCHDCGQDFPADCTDAGYRHALSTGHDVREVCVSEVVRAPRSGHGHNVNPEFVEVEE